MLSQIYNKKCTKMQLRNGKIIHVKTWEEESDLIERYRIPVIQSESSFLDDVPECLPNIENVKTSIGEKIKYFVNNQFVVSYDEKVRYAMDIFTYIDKVLPVIVKEHGKSWYNLLTILIARIESNRDVLIKDLKPVKDLDNILIKLDKIHDNVSRVIKNW